MKISEYKFDLAQARAKMSNKDLQEKAEISDVSLARIRRGLQKPRPSTVGRLAAALGVDPQDLLEQEA